MAAKTDIMVMKQVIEFDLNDKIYSLKKPLKEYKSDSKSCMVCSVKFKSDTIKGHCKFCGNYCCFDCVRVKRKFISKNKKVKKARVCRFCHAKFLIKESVNDSLNEIRVREEELNMLRVKYNEKATVVN